MNIIETNVPGLVGKATFGGWGIRITGSTEQPWFVLSDVCYALGITDHCVAARKLSGDEKGQYLILSPGGVQETTCISESGLYAVILRCRNAMVEGTAAFRFRRWVTNEVLPSIRKAGSYSAKQEEPATIQTQTKRIALDMLPGDKFGRLTIVAESEIRDRHRMVVAKCDCGSEFTARATQIRTGKAYQCPVCSRKKGLPPSLRIGNDFLLSTYQLALAEASKGGDTRPVMEWCHKKMLDRVASQ